MFAVTKQLLKHYYLQLKDAVLSILLFFETVRVIIIITDCMAFNQGKSVSSHKEFSPYRQEERSGKRWRRTRRK